MKIDLTGERFGKLTVIREASPYISPTGKKNRKWLCRCDCGNEVTVLQSALTSAKHGKTSCGSCCIRSNMEDMTGQRFGRLTVLEPAPLKKSKPNGMKTGWRCRCDCGNEVILTGNELRSGQHKSCGCLVSEMARDKIESKNTIGLYDGTIVSAIQPNRNSNKNSSTGVLGVCWSKSHNRYIASIGVRGKDINLGHYKTLDEAAKNRKEAEKKYYAPIIKEYEDIKNGERDK